MTGGGSYNIAYIFGVVTMGSTAGTLQLDACSYFAGSCSTGYTQKLMVGSFLVASPVA